MTAAEFIADQEGFSETPYKDSAGYWTIGFGRLLTRDKKAPMPTERTTRQREMVEHFIPDVERCKAQVVRIFGAGDPGQSWITSTPERLTALTSFAYNLGVHALETSELRKLIVQYWRTSTMVTALKVALEWVDWHIETVGGKRRASEGLIDRRRREVALFFGISG